MYFDFSGYSDIALGLGYLFGLRLAVNFRQPFAALTPQDFWRRWHITLSFWIRDYLFTPLARLRRSRRWADFALVVAMALAGLWHGANCTFIVWGVGWALAIFLWHMADRQLARLGVAQWVLTFGIWLVLLAFFRSSDVGAALRYIATMFGGGGAGTAPLPDDGSGRRSDRARLRRLARAALVGRLSSHAANDPVDAALRRSVAARALRGPRTVAAAAAEGAGQSVHLFPVLIMVRKLSRAIAAILAGAMLAVLGTKRSFASSTQRRCAGCCRCRRSRYMVRISLPVTATGQMSVACG